MTGNNKCLLDTSIVLHVFKQDKRIAARLDEFDQLFITPIVVGELCYGAYASADPARHLKQVNEFLQNCSFAYLDNTTADIYGAIKANLKQKGKPIPENDIWIAALAKQYDLPLFTTDKHFDEIENLESEGWGMNSSYMKLIKV